MKRLALLLLLCACDNPAQPMAVDASVPDADVPDAEVLEPSFYAETVLRTEEGDEIRVLRTDGNDFYLGVNECEALLTPDEFKRLQIHMHDLNEVSW